MIRARFIPDLQSNNVDGALPSALRNDDRMSKALFPQKRKHYVDPALSLPSYQQYQPIPSTN